MKVTKVAKLRSVLQRSNLYLDAVCFFLWISLLVPER